MNRTISDAVAQLDLMVGQVPPSTHAEYSAEVEIEKAKAEAGSMTVAHNSMAAARSDGEQAWTQVTAIRDEAQVFASDLQAGRVSVAEARDRFNALNRQLLGAAKRRQEFERRAAHAETIAADPLAYAEQMHAKYPTTRPRFTF